MSETMGRLLAAGQRAEVFEWGSRAVKLCRSTGSKRVTFREAAIHAAVECLGLPVPTVWSVQQIDPMPSAAAIMAPKSNRKSVPPQPEAVAGGLPAAERSHARIIEALAAPSPGAFGGATIARLEGRHRALGGNALRAAVLGANDGLCSNLSLVMGVAGADLGPHAILVTGLAGLLAGACSMALGEWLSVSTTRESYQRQIKTEADELEQVPEEEEEELALIYQAKGLPVDQAKGLAQRLIANKATALDTLVREELGIDPDELGGSAWAAAGTSFLLFAIGAIFPVAPYFWVERSPAVIASLAASGLALFLIGAGTTLFTGLGVWFSGLRQLLIGFAAAGVTYGVGKLIGVAITG